MDRSICKMDQVSKGQPVIFFSGGWLQMAGLQDNAGRRVDKGKESLKYYSFHRLSETQR